MTDYVEESGLNLHDHVDISGLLLQDPDDATVPIFARDDIYERVPISNENYIKLLEKLLEETQKQIDKFKEEFK